MVGNKKCKINSLKASLRSGGAGCVSTAEDYIKFLEALRIGDVILKKETIALMATDQLTEQQRAMFNANGNRTEIGYGLGMRTPLENSPRTDFGWGGAAGAHAAVDPVNNISFFYVQHVLAPPNMSLRKWLFLAVCAELRGEKIDIPLDLVDLTSNLTY